MNFSTEPKNKNNAGWGSALIVILVLAAALAWWQKDRVQATLSSQLSPRLNQPANELAGVAPTPVQTPAAVKLVYSAVVDDDTPAFTADLYLTEAEHPDAPDWAGIDGRTSVQTYTVQSGDTLWGIAAQFGLDVDTLRWSNQALARNPDLLTPGTDLTILPVIGAYHTVAPGETLADIAAQYGVAEVDISNYPPNGLTAPDAPAVGQRLIVPNGRRELVIPAPPPDPDYPLAWPLVGVVTQGYGPEHRAVDIGSAYGAGVYAAEAGTVVHAQWARTGYGFTVIIDHGNNRQTLYSHLKGALVQPGQAVARGEIIGAVGSTGNSTGPHVHFEVRQDGERVNPFDYLRPM